MAGFLYYLPNEKQQPSKERLAELNLGHIWADKLTAMPIQHGGPGECRSGLLVGDPKRMGEYAVRWMPGEQEWLETPDGWWLGWYRDAKPGPGDLAREQQLAGYDLTMGDGNVWTLPLVRNVSDAGDPVCMLPAVLVRDKVTRGLVPGPPIERYRYLWEATEAPWLAMVTESELDEADAEKAVAEIYGANYVTGAEELVALGLYSTELRPVGLLALSISYTRWAAWVEAKKKTAPQSPADGATTCVGEAG